MTQALRRGTVGTILGLLGVLILAATSVLAAEPTTVPARPLGSAMGPDDASPTGFVQAAGTDLVVDGRPYRFTGINIYNSNSVGDCWYHLNGRPLERSLGHLPRGETVIRAWFFQRMATRGGRRDWSVFDRTLRAARDRGMRVIVTFDDHWGACSHSGIKPVSFYASRYRRVVERGHRTTYRRFVAEVVERYRDDPTILMWQLMNEAETQRPDGRCARASVLRDFAADMAGLVKSIDPHHLLSVGTIGTGQCGALGADYVRLHAIPEVDVCEYHDYGERSPVPAHDPLTIRLSQCRALDKPLFVGEMGVQNRADLDRRARRLARQARSHLEDGVVGVLLWDWRDRANGGSARRGYEIGPGDPALDIIGIEHSLPHPALAAWRVRARACDEGRTALLRGLGRSAESCAL